MSVKAAEYSKRTCLICGCHTNQTINIYEPRSGPNIVHLIQAKFKFQPLNDDKYLCFSCNNWLINWHSLQALNSNEPESPSGTFRSHMNMVMEENADDKATAPITPLQKIRPVARVSPRIYPATTRIQNITEISAPMRISSPIETTETAQSTIESIDTTTTQEPFFVLSGKLARNLKIYRTICKTCKRRIVCITQTKCINIVKSCKKCRKAQTNVQMLPKTQTKLVQINNTNSNNSKNNFNYNNHQTTETSNKAQQTDTLQVTTPSTYTQGLYRNQRWQPSLDGKVVSKLRSLGTTLARDAIDGKRNILSEAKRKPQWERQLDDDEILLDFNTTISEVLPIEQRKQPLPLTVDLTDDDDDTISKTYPISLSNFTNLGEKVIMPEIDHQLPKGLTISLVTY